MTIRKFDFTAAYDELEKLRGDGSGYPCDVEGIQEQFGERAYQVQRGTAKPREGMPVRVRLRERKLEIIRRGVRFDLDVECKAKGFKNSSLLLC